MHSARGRPCRLRSGCHAHPSARLCGCCEPSQPGNRVPTPAFCPHRRLSGTAHGAAVLQLTGPSTRAWNRPPRSNHMTLRPSSMQRPSSTGVNITSPKQTIPPRWCIGTCSRFSFPTITTDGLPLEAQVGLGHRHIQHIEQHRHSGSSSGSKRWALSAMIPRSARFINSQPSSARVRGAPPNPMSHVK